MAEIRMYAEFTAEEDAEYRELCRLELELASDEGSTTGEALDDARRQLDELDRVRRQIEQLEGARLVRAFDYAQAARYRYLCGREAQLLGR